MECPYCGRPVGDHAKFCGTCGRPIPGDGPATTAQAPAPAPLDGWDPPVPATIVEDTGETHAPGQAPANGPAAPAVGETGSENPPASPAPEKAATDDKPPVAPPVLGGDRPGNAPPPGRYTRPANSSVPLYPGPGGLSHAGEPLRPYEYMILLLLAAVPIAGLVFLLVLAFGGTAPRYKAFARGVLLFIAAAAACAALFMVSVGVGLGG